MSKQLALLAGGGLAGCFGLMIGYKFTVFYVDTGFRAIKFHKYWGVKEKAYREGWHLMMPWFERPIIFDVKAHPIVIKSITGSKDL